MNAPLSNTLASLENLGGISLVSSVDILHALESVK